MINAGVPNPAKAKRGESLVHHNVMHKPSNVWNNYIVGEERKSFLISRDVDSVLSAYNTHSVDEFKAVTSWDCYGFACWHSDTSA